MKKQGIKKFDIVTVGGATRDIMFYSRNGEIVKGHSLSKQQLLAFEYGAKIVADKLFFSFGGGASNTAATFAKWGFKTAIACRLGDDENGRAVLKKFHDSKIDTALVAVDKKIATGFSVILTLDSKEKEHIVFAFRGANDFLRAEDLPLSKIQTDWFYVSSLPKVGWEQIMRRITATKKRIIWNPGGRQLEQMARLKKFLPNIEVLSLNRDESWEFRKLKDIKGVLKHIHNLGPKIVVITDGANGAYAYDGVKYYFMKAVNVQAVDTVGVGDAFTSAFTSALICGKSIKSALSWGMKNSSSVITKIGAQNGILPKRPVA